MGNEGDAAHFWHKLYKSFPPNISEPIQLYRLLTCKTVYLDKKEFSIKPSRGSISSWTMKARALDYIAGIAREMNTSANTARIAVSAIIQPNQILATHNSMKKAFNSITKDWENRYPEIRDKSDLANFPNWPEREGREAEVNLNAFSMLHVRDRRREMMARGGYANQWEFIVETPHAIPVKLERVYRTGSDIIRQGIRDY